MVQAGDALSAADFAELVGPLAAAGPFELDASKLDPIRFSRLPLEHDAIDEVTDRSVEQRTEVSFELRPQRPDFSRAGLYGLGMIGRPRIDVQSTRIGSDDLPDLNRGFAYSAGVRIEHEDAAIDGTAYVSSSLLGLSYGRLGRLWYGGIDVNVERFRSADGVTDPTEVVSLDVTTGRRLGITGLGSDAPLWLLSVQGNLDLEEEPDPDHELQPNWYVNPSLFWDNPDFTFSAQMQLPVAPVLDDEDAAPDYRLRAVFEKRFR